MVILGGWVFLMSEVPMYMSEVPLYLAHKKHPAARTLQWDYLGSYGGPKGGAVSYERVTPVRVATCRDIQAQRDQPLLIFGVFQTNKTIIYVGNVPGSIMRGAWNLHTIN